MAAEMICSAVVGETLNRVVSRRIASGSSSSSHGEEDGTQERLEMARGRMEAVLELSTRWPVTDVSLLRWRRRLKRAAEDCDGALLLLRRRKHRAVEADEAASRFPRRVARATRSLVSALVGGRGSESKDDSSPTSAAVVRRFERLADGASEFLKLVELGGARGPRQHAFADPLVGRLLAGETLDYVAARGKGRMCRLTVRPMSFEERGVEAFVGFTVQDFMAPARSFSVGFVMRLSESTDVLGIMIDCVRSSTSQFRVAGEEITRELAQLPTKDLTWIAHTPYGLKKYWEDVHDNITRLSRPNPLCCTDHHHHHRSRNDGTAAAPSPPPPATTPLSTTYPEHVICMYLQFYIVPAQPQPQPQPALKMVVLYLPHDTPDEEDGVHNVNFPAASQSYALEVIDDEAVAVARHAAACQLQDVDERLLPEAMDRLRRSAAGSGTTHQVYVRSSHGTAHILLEKTRRTRGGRGRRRASTSGSAAGAAARAMRVADVQDEIEMAAKRLRRDGVERWRELARELLKLRRRRRQWHGGDMVAAGGPGALLGKDGQQQGTERWCPLASWGDGLRRRPRWIETATRSIQLRVDTHILNLEMHSLARQLILRYRCLLLDSHGRRTTMSNCREVRKWSTFNFNTCYTLLPNLKRTESLNTVELKVLHFDGK
uniref:Uncharacterized protein n=1 Tax=Leersia perrieri TaxID=77586 RepID=A0A0D9VWD0_9ORYZ